MAKKNKRFQIPFAPPARPAITHSLTPSLPRSLAYFIRLPVTTQPQCDDFNVPRTHARTHVRTLGGYPFQESPRLVHSPGAFPTQPSPAKKAPTYNMRSAVPCRAVAVMSE